MNCIVGVRRWTAATHVAASEMLGAGFVVPSVSSA